MAKKPADKPDTRNELVEAAWELFAHQGYEGTTINAIIEKVGMSKGAFYHYFDSKQALLDGLIEQMLDEAELVLRPIVEAKDLSAVEKMQRYLDTGGRWKIAQKAFMLDLLRVWHTDSNSLVRQKQETAAMKRIAPMLSEIIRQGIAEGAFTTKYPDQFGSMILGLSRGIEEAISELLLTEEPPPDALQRLEAIIGAYSESFERILGAPAGSLLLGDVDMLKEWLAEPEDVENS